jgi:hypothetical protein
LPRSMGDAAKHDAIMYPLFRCWPVMLIHRNGLPMCFLGCPSTTRIIVWIWLRCYRTSGKPPNLFNKIQQACKNNCSFFGITCTILDTVEMNLENRTKSNYFGHVLGRSLTFQLTVPYPENSIKYIYPLRFAKSVQLFSKLVLFLKSNF